LANFRPNLEEFRRTGDDDNDEDNVEMIGKTTDGNFVDHGRG
jgi:hypothetical protein